MDGSGTRTSSPSAARMPLPPVRALLSSGWHSLQGDHTSEYARLTCSRSCSDPSSMCSEYNEKTQSGEGSGCVSAAVADGLLNTQFQPRRRSRRNLLLLTTCLFILAALSATVLIYLILVPRTCTTRECVQAASALLERMDITKDPCVDFFQYSCGRWINETDNPMPQRTWHTIAESGFRAYDTLAKTIQKISNGEATFALSEGENSVVQLYNQCMDMEKLKQRGHKSWLEMVEDMGGWPLDEPQDLVMARTPHVLEELILSAYRFASYPILWVGVDLNYLDSKNYIITIDEQLPMLVYHQYYVMDKRPVTAERVLTDDVHPFLILLKNAGLHMAKLAGHDPESEIVQRSLADAMELEWNLVLISTMLDNEKKPEHELYSVIDLRTLKRLVRPVSILPALSAELAKSAPPLHLMDVGINDKQLQGYGVDLVKNRLVPLWSSSLNVPATSKVVAVHGKPANQRTHSQGRVMIDRSVLYKYVNPNLIAIATLDDKAQSLSIFLIDSVSGQTVHSARLGKASGPVHLVHCENWIAYSYWSEKGRRTELGIVELYEGEELTNTEKFDSLSPTKRIPKTEQSAFIFSQGVTAMAVSETEQGLSHRSLLVALPFGNVFEVSRRLLDAMRPLEITAEMREEGGFIPYIPEIPIATEDVVNYNQTIYNVKGIKTASSGLESTSLVLIYGLDLFYTRLTPSGTFDILKDDFDHVLISLVLVALIVGSYICRKLSRNNALKQQWA